MPQVSLSASAGSLIINKLNYNTLTVWSLGGSLLAPLFDAGRREAALDAGTAQRDQAAYSSYLEDLDAQRNLFQAELTMATLRQDELDYRVQLYGSVAQTLLSDLLTSPRD